MTAIITMRRWRLVPYALLMPFYWVLLGVAAWNGMWQLLVAPFSWEKTPHQEFTVAGDLK
jgi:hypothetical protein